MFQLRTKSATQPGYDADLVIIDPNKEVTRSRTLLHSHCDYTPYEGRSVRGYPVATLSRGRQAMSGGEFTGRAGGGQHVERGPQTMASSSVAVIGA